MTNNIILSTPCPIFITPLDPNYVQLLPSHISFFVLTPLPYIILCFNPLPYNIVWMPPEITADLSLAIILHSFLWKCYYNNTVHLFSMVHNALRFNNNIIILSLFYFPLKVEWKVLLHSKKELLKGTFINYGMGDWGTLINYWVGGKELSKTCAKSGVQTFWPLCLPPPIHNWWMFPNIK